MRVVAGARTDVGRVRDMNQDAYLVSDPLFGIADGMGGHAAGDVAAETAVSTVKEMFEQAPPDRPNDLARYLREANARVYRKASEEPGLQGMGTTFTLIHVVGEQAHLGHVGDSRAYLYREGRLEQITKDHTLVQRMVDEGRIRPEEAPHHPQRNVISRALGIDDNIEVDISTLDLRDGDRLLICSDGLTSMLSDEQIATILGGGGEVEALADRLVGAANEAGGEDNITVVLLDVTNEGEGSLAPASESEDEATPPPPPPADDALVADPDDDEDDGSPGRARKWIVALVVLIILGAGAFVAARMTLANSWFVGTTETGTVAIFKGIPEDIVGLSFRDVHEESDLQADDLPSFLRSDVDEGIKVESLEEAQETIEDLKQRSEDFASPTSGKRSK